MTTRKSRRCSRSDARRTTTAALCLLGLVLAAGLGIGQSGGGTGARLDPEWRVDADYPDDVFTFARIRYKSHGSGWGDDGWMTDYPESDRNFAFRLQQLTALKVNPECKVLDLTDEGLFDFPFIYIVEPVGLYFDSDEIAALRRYLLNGGFLMIDDLWGDEQWNGIYSEMKKVFPDREPAELSIDHEIFHWIYEFEEKPQVPSIHAAQRGRSRGITWQGGADAQTPHFRAFYDDDGRMVALICHNNDIGDGWEEETEDEWYFREFSEKKSYPMGINIVMYAMTH